MRAATGALTIAIVLCVCGVPDTARSRDGACAYIEDDGTFVISLVTGKWRLITTAGDYGSTAMDAFEFDGSEARFEDRTEIQPAAVIDARLRGSFELGAQGQVWFRDPPRGIAVHLLDPSVEAGFCN